MYTASPINRVEARQIERLDADAVYHISDRLSFKVQDMARALQPYMSRCTDTHFRGRFGSGHLKGRYA